MPFDDLRVWIAALDRASQLKQIGTIAVPGEPLASFDIGFIDQTAHRYYLADRTNRALDIFDAATDKFITRVPGFVGQMKSNDESGPDGVVVIGTEAWVGDGDQGRTRRDRSQGWQPGQNATCR